MTIAGHRPERIAEEIRNEIGLMLAGELKDPRLVAEVDIRDVRVSPDLRQVRVLVQIPEENDRADALAGLRAASGYIRHELVERLQLRRAPEIFFHLDISEEYDQHIDDLLRQARSRSQGS